MQDNACNTVCTWLHRGKDLSSVSLRIRREKSFYSPFLSLYQLSLPSLFPLFLFLPSFYSSPLKTPSASGHFNVLWSNMNVVKPHFLKLLLPYQKVNHFPRWVTECDNSHRHRGLWVHNYHWHYVLKHHIPDSEWSLLVCLLVQVLWADPKGSAMSQRAKNATV